MVGQLLRRLADAEADASAGGRVAASGHTAGREAAGSGDEGGRDAGGSSGHDDGSGRDGGGGGAASGAASGARFAVCVTGDHSTPVMFGDHSHEPVPFAIAHVADVVSGWNADCSSALLWQPSMLPRQGNACCTLFLQSSPWRRAFELQAAQVNIAAKFPFA